LPAPLKRLQRREHRGMAMIEVEFFKDIAACELRGSE